MVSRYPKETLSPSFEVRILSTVISLISHQKGTVIIPSSAFPCWKSVTLISRLLSSWCSISKWYGEVILPSKIFTFEEKKKERYNSECFWSWGVIKTSIFPIVFLYPASRETCFIYSCSWSERTLAERLGFDCKIQISKNQSPIPQIPIQRFLISEGCLGAFDAIFFFLFPFIKIKKTILHCTM